MSAAQVPQKVWVAYATPEQQFHIEVEYVPGMSVQDAIQRSTIEQQVQLPENYSLGIFGVSIQDRHQLLQPGDRVEIYRPLLVNPRDIRRNRAAANPVGRYGRGNRFRSLK
ncbi:RnfH family protein [Acinetobacter sp. WZC-1]|uniref:RnfH family protein n=1 Tax=Acinetobacter sp. WZC-1 TaxID=3459034 RepID=UPI00403DDADF